ncbi:MAG: anhydro-N-acetylmuramic acid kinase [Tatlockia sp.]|nr:anhydro-N-acetylmuramic acid kinase [Tatlockia sp.]
MTTNQNVFMGLMSGTSMDGIDAAIIDFSSNFFIGGLTRPYSVEAKNYLNLVINGELRDFKHYCQLNTLLGKEFATAALELLNKVNIPAAAIKAIGSHGQTLCHDATADIPYTLQSGCAHTIAELTGITVVADFRTRDLVVGGQGAPFAPLYHQALFKKQQYPLAVVNIGGIANLSFLANESEVSGYDLGPGNCLMDGWIKQNRNYDYDKNGDWAASGNVINSLLDSLLADPYFQRHKPKSIGKEYFSLDWLSQFLQSSYAPVDVQATLLMLTAMSIAKPLQEQSIPVNKLFICGGGAHNLALIKALAKLLPEIDVQSTEQINIDPDFIEALMFAWFAEKTLSYTPIDLGQITGSKKPTILGAIYPGLSLGKT